MTRDRASRIRRGLRSLALAPAMGLVALTVAGGGAGPAVAEVIPPAGLLERLASEAYPDRVRAERELAEWAGGQGRDAMYWLADQVDQHPDPEVRARVLTALREVVLDDLTRRRPGFVGVRMGAARVDCEGEVRMGVEVEEVTSASPAEKAGVQPGDVIVELNGSGWMTREPQQEFAGRVGKLGPGTRVKFRVYRAGEFLELELELAARPWSAGEYQVEGGRMVPVPGKFYLNEGQAREDAFRNWLREYRAQEGRPD